MKLKTNFIRNGNAVLKQVKLPEKNEKLAELVGIILGDGNIHEYKKGKKAGTYMIRIAGDYRKEYDYFHNYVGVLFKDLFEVEPKFHKKKNSNTYYIIVHSKLIVEYFKEMGLKPKMTRYFISNHVPHSTILFSLNGKIYEADPFYNSQLNRVDKTRLEQIKELKKMKKFRFIKPGDYTKPKYDKERKTGKFHV